MRKIWIVLAILLVGTLSACGNTDSESDFRVTTTLFPQYDITRSIAPEEASVSLILPPGVSPHDYEPSPQVVASILESDLFIYTSEWLEPWVSSILEEATNHGVTVLEMADFVVLMSAEEDHDDHEEDDHDHGEIDPHFWSDPNNLILMTNAIKRELVRLYPEEEVNINTHADAFVDELRHFDEMFETLVANISTTTVMYGGHNALSYFANAYGLEFVLPYIGFSDDAEPTPGALTSMIELMETANTQYLFSEALLSNLVADTITEETGAENLVLYAMGKIGADDFESGMTLFDMMNHNLEMFMLGLGYNGPEIDTDHDHDE